MTKLPTEALLGLQLSLAREEALMLRVEIERGRRNALLAAAGVGPGDRVNATTGEVVPGPQPKEADGGDSP